ncbi:MAG: ABC transporter ATP-binding protein [Chlorobi bacterium]|nr:ABC transporter ATP-binding protein [Chlorobiota bacterium]
MAESIIELVGLTKRYGTFTAVDHLNLSVGKGEIFGLLGPNGAGKSTTILMILGLTEPDSGTVTVCGTDSVRFPVEVKKKVGYLPEDVGFYDKYSGLENLVYTGRLNGMTETEAIEKAEVLLDSVGLSEHIHKKAGNYSRGMRQRLGLADVLIKDPEVIILDEPIMGIDPAGIREFLEMIVRLSKEEDITVLFSSHQLYQAQQVCDRVGLFVGGKLLAEGDINSLSKKLAGNSPYLVEVGIAGNSKTGERQRKNHPAEILQKMDGVLTVEEKKGRYYVGCTRDISSGIARELVLSGFELTYLTKKEYGLEDIYYRYFEGEANDE